MRVKVNWFRFTFNGKTSIYYPKMPIVPPSLDQHCEKRQSNKSENVCVRERARPNDGATGTMTMGSTKCVCASASAFVRKGYTNCQALGAHSILHYSIDEFSVFEYNSTVN